MAGCLQQGMETSTTSSSTTAPTVFSTTTSTTSTSPASVTEEPYWMRYIREGNLSHNLSGNSSFNISLINNISSNITSNQTNISAADETDVGDVVCFNASVCGGVRVEYGCEREFVEIGQNIYEGELIKKYVYYPICRYPGTNRSFCEHWGPVVSVEEKCWQQGKVCDRDHNECTAPADGNYLDFVQERYELKCECGNGKMEAGNPGCEEECEPPGEENNRYCPQEKEGCTGHRYWKRPDDRGRCSQSCICDLDDKTYKCLKYECGAECSNSRDCNDGNPETVDKCSEDCMCEHTPIEG